MTEKVEVPSIKQLFNRFIAEPIQKNGVTWFNTNKAEVKANLLEEFRKEIFGQIIFKLGPEAATMNRDDLANLDGVHNILKESFRRWRRLCILCGESGIPFISLEDLEVQTVQIVFSGNCEDQKNHCISV